MATVILNGESIEVQIGQTLFQAADHSVRGAAYEIASSCQREGACRECIVQVRSGSDALTQPTQAEDFLVPDTDSEAGVYRLACQARITRSDAVVEVETFKRRLKIAADGRNAGVSLDPWIRRHNGAVYHGEEMLARHDGPILGAAIDIGTTTIVLHIVDLESGKTLSVHALENPQKFGGSDVIHRISYDRHHPGQLHRTILSLLNDSLRTSGANRLSIFAVTVAGNPTMRDLFFDIDVQSIGQKPYVSQTQADMMAGRRDSTAIWSDGKTLGLSVHPKARVYGLPLVSNHVGADMSAVLATIPIHEYDKPFMVLDIGTNTEAAIGNRDRLICLSCPAGPAFEGGRLSCGMPACDGAIEAIRHDAGRWHPTTIGDARPRGFCGSGLVDLLAELYSAGEMNELGRLTNHDGRITLFDQPRVAFTAQDASELAQAKAANAMGQVVLLRKYGIQLQDLAHFYLAGAFATKINLDNARKIGLLLPVQDDQVVRLGNASIEGAKAALLNQACLRRIENLVQNVEHVELEQEPDFFDLYVEMAHFRPIAMG